MPMALHLFYQQLVFVLITLDLSPMQRNHDTENNHQVQNKVYTLLGTQIPHMWHDSGKISFTSAVRCKIVRLLKFESTGGEAITSENVHDVPETRSGFLKPTNLINCFVNTPQTESRSNVNYVNPRKMPFSYLPKILNTYTRRQRVADSTDSTAQNSSQENKQHSPDYRTAHP
eukprot:gene6219-12599_t